MRSTKTPKGTDGTKPAPELGGKSHMINVTFPLKAKVKIVELGRNGIVIRIVMDLSGLTYQVRYFDNAELRSEHFFEEELQGVENVR